MTEPKLNQADATDLINKIESYGRCIRDDTRYAEQGHDLEAGQRLAEIEDEIRFLFDVLGQYGWSYIRR